MSQVVLTIIPGFSRTLHFLSVLVLDTLLSLGALFTSAGRRLISQVMEMVAKGITPPNVRVSGAISRTVPVVQQTSPPTCVISCRCGLFTCGCPCSLW
jgi:hypothetical protein